MLEPSELPLILIVDDDFFVRKLLSRYLLQEHYRIAEASNGREALEIYLGSHPDLILLDAVMPEMDGFEFCLHLKRIPDSVHTPVLMITGLEDQQSVDRAYDSGAADYVTKPIHWATLRQRVRRLIEESNLRRQLEAANLELRRLTIIDSLTQLANRRRFDEYLEQEWGRALREQTSVSLILCDIDCFKVLNDTYGHQTGDICLQRISEAIHQSVGRTVDLVARYGGEEFVVVLPNTPGQGAVQVAERICNAVKALKIPNRRSPLGQFVTVSCGVAATIPNSFLVPSKLIEAADQALYQAKEAGRDRVVLNSMWRSRVERRPPLECEIPFCDLQWEGDDACRNCDSEQRSSHSTIK